MKLKKEHFLFVLFSLLLIATHKAYNFNKMQDISFDIENSIKKRTKDYEQVFIHINKHGNDSIKKIENKNILLSSDKLIPIGSFKYELVNHYLEKKNRLDQVTLSTSYYEEEIFEEPLVDVYIYTKSKGNKTIKISTTILFSDIFKYSKNKEQINEAIKYKKLEIEEIKNYVLEKDDKSDLKLFTLLFLLALYYLKYLYKLYIKSTEVDKYKENEVCFLKKIEENQNIHNSMREIIFSTCKNEECLLQIIKKIIHSLSNNLSQKNINFELIDFNDDFTIRGNISHWYHLLFCLMDNFINQEPPNSKISVFFKKITTNDTLSFSEIIIKDFHPIKIQNELFEKIKIEKLSIEMNIFIKTNFNNNDGNTLTIAIPDEKQPFPIDKNSNIIFLSR
jgi:hypothetical protein